MKWTRVEFFNGEGWQIVPFGSIRSVHALLVDGVLQYYVDLEFSSLRVDREEMERVAGLLEIPAELFTESRGGLTDRGVEFLERLMDEGM